MKALIERRHQLNALGAHLRGLARSHNIAIVVANQVSDRFSSLVADAQLDSPMSTPSSSSAAATTAAAFSVENPLTLNHQERFFTGCGNNSTDSEHFLSKIPSMGLVWSNQLDARIALVRGSYYPDRPSRRWMRVAFSSWSPSVEGRGVEFTISANGLTSIADEEDETSIG